MGLLLLGLALFAALHLLRSAAPGLRARLLARTGSGDRWIIAGGLLLAVALMTIGYRTAPVVQVWSPPSAFGYLNNLLVFLAVYLFVSSYTRPGTAWLFGSLTHPQLTGFILWALAHLLVRGHLAAIVLFGGLLIWATAEVILSSRVPSLVNRAEARITSPVVHLVLAAAVFLLIAGLHALAGVNPFGGL